MTQSEEIRDLFARYTAEVGRHLTRRSREDIERELATTLADRLDDRVQPEGREASPDDAVALLKEMGHPRKTAASYLTHGHLVGPALFPLFSMVCRIVLPIVAAVLIGVQALMLSLGTAPAAPVAEIVFRIFGSAASAALQAFAAIVIVFAILERMEPLPRVRSVLDPWDPWDPRELPRLTDGAAIRVSDQILTIVFGALFLLFLAFLPRLIETGIRNAGSASARLGLSDGFRRLLPLFFASTGADILVAAFLLTRRVLTTATVAAKAAAKALGIVVSGFLLAVWPFVFLQPGASAGADLGVRVLNQVIRVGCILGIVVGCFEMARDIIRFERGRRTSA